MPRFDGLKVLAAMKSDDRMMHLPVAMLSSFSDSDLRRAAASLGAIDWLVKGNVSPAQLSVLVEGWTGAGL